MVIYLNDLTRLIVEEIEFPPNGMILAYNDENGYMVIDPKDVIRIRPVKK